MSKQIIYFFIIIIIGVFAATFYFLNSPQIETTIVKSEVIEILEKKVVPPENREASVPILIYHQVRQFRDADSEGAKEFIVIPENFEKHLKYLQDNDFTAISFDDLNSYLLNSFDLPKKPVIISFDDGTIGQYENAFPLLKKYNFTATFFIFTNPIGKSKNYMTWDQLIEMDRAGMEIGDHGWYHLYFDRISEEELNREIVQSKQRLEEKLGHEISTIAYPFGSSNEHVVQRVKDAGYKSARGIVNGTTHTSENLYNLNAYFITNSYSRFVNIVSQ